MDILLGLEKRLIPTCDMPVARLSLQRECFITALPVPQAVPSCFYAPLNDDDLLLPEVQGIRIHRHIRTLGIWLVCPCGL